jgi:predicted GIY-YIG superfamily endonuclease/DNA-binding XRE family transcriptional regulator
MLKNKLKIPPSKKYRASTLAFKEITKPIQYKEFFQENHIDGYVQSSFMYGLFDGDMPLSMMSFRFNTTLNCFEIARFCSKVDVQVYGGFTKLLSNYPKDQALVSYSNSRFSSGAVYSKNGFSRIESSEQLSYYYTNGKERLFRTRCQKRVLSKEVLSLNLSEKQYAEQGYFSEKFYGVKERLYKIYDFGQMKWIMNAHLLQDDRTYYIYKYTHNKNGKIYIGYTDNPDRRQIQHKSEIVSAVNGLYEENDFSYEIIETVKGLAVAKSREIDLIREHNSYHNGYNKSHGGEGSCVSKKLHPELVEEIVQLLKENTLTIEQIGEKYEVNEATIRGIQFGKIWKTITKGETIQRKKMSAKGENQGAAMLTEKQVIEIKTKIIEGNTRASLAKQYGVKSTTIEAIASGRNWGHITVPGFDPEKLKAKENTNVLTEELVKQIKLRLKEGIKNAQVAREFNVSKTTIGHIANGKSWVNVVV